ncbi:hypothetical protein F4679DRAFT_435394 [Xylaria curta]|nr:hypothetical protein F4679DRAFT_435394 [Xylaria curta]
MATPQYDLPLPDVGAITDSITTMANSITTVSNNIALVRNMPAYDNGRQLINAIHDMFNELKTHMTANELNNLTRWLNNSVTSRDARLTTLHAIATNTPIVNFPETKAALSRLTSPVLDDILAQLNQAMPAGTSVGSKRKRLALLAGANNILDP